MKRGYMDWDKKVLPPAALERRRQTLMETAKRAGAKAVIVYGDVYSADELSYHSNYAPYWCNCAAVLTEDDFYLVTGHNNRVNPWISTLTGLTEDKLLASGFKVPERIGKSLKERFPEGGRVAVIGKYVMAEVVKELQCCGFEVVGLSGEAAAPGEETADENGKRLDPQKIMAAGFTVDDAYKETAAFAAGILRAAFVCGDKEYGAGGTSKTVAAEIEYDTRKNGAMDILLYVSYKGLEFGLPEAEKAESGRYTIYGLMQYLGVWVSYAKTFGCDMTAVRERLDQEALRLVQGNSGLTQCEGAVRNGVNKQEDAYEFTIKRVVSDVISDLNPRLSVLNAGDVIAVSAYEKVSGRYCEDMYAVMDKGAVVL